MLFIIPTPIGNLEDITERAINTLKNVDFIIAENPIYSRKLLNHYHISNKPIFQFAEHNEHKILSALLDRLTANTGGLITDAGTPGISDPGFRLVRACIDNNIHVQALPGANAALTALSASGLPTHKFLFLGFLGKTEHKVITSLNEAANIKATAIIYESPERLLKTLEYINTHFPQNQLVVARELTKIHEEYLRGTSQEILDTLKNRPSIKGEVTILISFK